MVKRGRNDACEGCPSQVRVRIVIRYPRGEFCAHAHRTRRPSIRRNISVRSHVISVARAPKSDMGKGEHRNAHRPHTRSVKTQSPRCWFRISARSKPPPSTETKTGDWLGIDNGTAQDAQSVLCATRPLGNRDARGTGNECACPLLTHSNSHLLASKDEVQCAFFHAEPGLLSPIIRNSRTPADSRPLHAGPNACLFHGMHLSR